MLNVGVPAWTKVRVNLARRQEVNEAVIRPWGELRAFPAVRIHNSGGRHDRRDRFRPLIDRGDTQRR